MKSARCLTALSLVCLFAANADAFAPPPLGALARAPLAATARKTAVSPLRLSMQQAEVRGICPICNDAVTTADVRERDDDGNYVHTSCVEGQNAAQGQARLSPQDISNLRRRNSVEAPVEKAGGFNPFTGFKLPFGAGAKAAPAAPARARAAPVETKGYDNYGGDGADIPDIPPPGSTGATPMFGGAGGAAPMRVNPNAPTQAPVMKQVGAPEGWRPPVVQEAAPPPPPKAVPTVRGSAVVGQFIPPQPKGERVYPAPGIPVPSYWVEGSQYLSNKKNEFEIGEPVAIYRSEGSVKFATILTYKINNDQASYRYDLQVDAAGSRYEDRYPDSIFKIMYDIETEGVVLREETTTKGWF